MPQTSPWSSTVPTEVSLARIRQRASDLPDRMERENISFYTKVREGYLLLAKQWPERVIVVDGTPVARRDREKNLGRGAKAPELTSMKPAVPNVPARRDRRSRPTVRAPELSAFRLLTSDF